MECLFPRRSPKNHSPDVEKQKDSYLEESSSDNTNGFSEKTTDVPRKQEQLVTVRSVNPSTDNASRSGSVKVERGSKRLAEEQNTPRPGQISVKKPDPVHVLQRGLIFEPDVAHSSGCSTTGAVKADSIAEASPESGRVPGKNSSSTPQADSRMDGTVDSSRVSPIDCNGRRNKKSVAPRELDASFFEKLQSIKALQNRSNN